LRRTVTPRGKAAMTGKKKIPQDGLYCITGEEFSRGRTNI